MRRPLRLLLAALAAGVATLAPRAAAGQATRTLTVSAVVQPFAYVVPEHDLNFFVVLPGVPKTVAPTSVDAGHFAITYRQNAKVELSFTLPTQLRSGANALAIGSWTGLHSQRRPATAPVAFTPSSAATQMQLGQDGLGYVWLGATVTPTAAQVPGAYTGTIVLTTTFRGF